MLYTSSRNQIALVDLMVFFVIYYGIGKQINFIYTTYICLHFNILQFFYTTPRTFHIVVYTTLHIIVYFTYCNIYSFTFHSIYLIKVHYTYMQLFTLHHIQLFTLQYIQLFTLHKSQLFTFHYIIHSWLHYPTLNVCITYICLHLSTCYVRLSLYICAHYTIWY